MKITTTRIAVAHMDMDQSNNHSIIQTAERSLFLSIRSCRVIDSTCDHACTCTHAKVVPQPRTPSAWVSIDSQDEERQIPECNAPILVAYRYAKSRFLDVVWGRPQRASTTFYRVSTLHDGSCIKSYGGVGGGEGRGARGRGRTPCCCLPSSFNL